MTSILCLFTAKFLMRSGKPSSAYFIHLHKPGIPYLNHFERWKHIKRAKTTEELKSIKYRRMRQLKLRITVE